MLNRPYKGTPEKGFAYWLMKIPEIVCLSVLWLICCLPVVTIVPASTALYDAVVNCILGDEIGTFRRYFISFKNSLLRGMPMSLLWGVIFFLYINTYLFALSYAEQSTVMAVISLVYLAVGILPLGVFSWVIPLFATYDYRFWELQRAAIGVTTIKMPITLLMEGIFLLGVVACFYVPALLIAIPALIPMAQQIIVKKVFSQVFEEDEEAEEE